MQFFISILWPCIFIVLLFIQFIFSKKIWTLLKKNDFDVKPIPSIGDFKMFNSLIQIEPNQKLVKKYRFFKWITYSCIIGIFTLFIVAFILELQ